MEAHHEHIINFYAAVGKDTDPGVRHKAYARYMEATGRDANAVETVGLAMQAHDVIALSHYDKVAKAAMFADGNHTLHSDHTKFPVVRIKGHGIVEMDR